MKQMQLNGFILRKENYHTREVAEIFNVSTDIIRRWCHAGLLNAAQVAPKGKNAKRDACRWLIWADGLHDLEVNKQALIRASMRYWPKLLQEVHKTSLMRRSRKGLVASQAMIGHAIEGEAS